MHLGANTQKFHAALHDARGRVAVAAHDAVGQAAVVHSDAHGRAVGATNVEQLHKALFQARQFGGIFLVGVFQLLEGARRIHIVAGIDAHFLHNARGHIGHLGVEMHIGHEGRVETAAVQGFADGAEVFGLTHSLRGEPHIVGTGLDDSDTLCHTGLRIGGECGGHALQSKRLLPTERFIADVHFVTASRLVVE